MLRQYLINLCKFIAEFATLNYCTLNVEKIKTLLKKIHDIEKDNEMAEDLREDNIIRSDELYQ